MPETKAEKARRLAVFAVRFEAAMWRSLYRWVFRRRRKLEPDGEAFRYTGTTMPVLLAFIGVSAIEIPILHWLLPWRTIEIIALIIGGYGLLWMLGLLASLRVHPHVVGPAGLRIRNGAMLDMTIPWEYIAEVRPRNRTMPSRPAQRFETTSTGEVLHLVVMSQTHVDIVFRGPTTVPLPKGESPPLSELRVAVDNPGGLVAAARPYVDDAALASK